MKNFWKDRNIFITGASGLLGAWLTKELIDKQANVICLIRDDVPNTNLIHFSLMDRITTVNGSVEDYTLLSRIINEYEIQTVFHLAAQTIVTVANHSP